MRTLRTSILFHHLVETLFQKPGLAGETSHPRFHSTGFDTHFSKGSESSDNRINRTFTSEVVSYDTATTGVYRMSAYPRPKLRLNVFDRP